MTYEPKCFECKYFIEDKINGEKVFFCSLTGNEIEPYDDACADFKPAKEYIENLKNILKIILNMMKIRKEKEIVKNEFIRFWKVEPARIVTDSFVYAEREIDVSVDEELEKIANEIFKEFKNLNVRKIILRTRYFYVTNDHDWECIEYTDENDEYVVKFEKLENGFSYEIELRAKIKK